jgi:hypothetical protein
VTRLALLILVLLTAGCGELDRKSATVGVDGIDELTVLQALDEWRHASGGAVDMVLVPADQADLMIYGRSHDGDCGHWFEFESKAAEIWIDPEHTCTDTKTVIMHELGHYIAGKGGHLDDEAALMFWRNRAEPIGITPADLEFVGVTGR